MGRNRRSPDGCHHPGLRYSTDAQKPTTLPQAAEVLLLLARVGRKALADTRPEHEPHRPGRVV